MSGETQLILIEIGTRLSSDSKLELFLICVHGTIMYKFTSRAINYLIGNILYKHLFDYCSLSKLYNIMRLYNTTFGWFNLICISHKYYSGVRYNYNVSWWIRIYNNCITSYLLCRYNYYIYYNILYIQVSLSVYTIRYTLSISIKLKFQIFTESIL